MNPTIPWELIDFNPARLGELGLPVPPMPAFERPKTARVAAIVTCPNYGAYLRECLDSLLAQTIRPRERSSPLAGECLRIPGHVPAPRAAPCPTPEAKQPENSRRQPARILRGYSN